jgi:hypothetical protein
MMEQQVFTDCLEKWQSSDGFTKFWPELADKWGYRSGEHLRWTFKQERKKRGIKKEDFLAKEIHESQMPRVAVIDLETLPAEVYTFGLYDQNIGIEQVISEVGFLSWAGKFLNESEVYSDILTSREAKIKDDKRITRSCWNFLNGCDILVGHNLCGFDIKLINTFFLKYNLPPLKFVLVDTLLIARNNFRFSSNKLDFINTQLGIRNKDSNEGFKLWRECHQGKQESLDAMLRYNVGDIFCTEMLFYKIRPYIKNMNVALYNEIESYQCPVCGSEELSNEGYYYTSAGCYESVRCSNCKCVSRKKNNLLTKRKKKSLLVNS